MPGAVETVSNMEKKNGKKRKKSRTKRMATAVVQEKSRTVVDKKVFTLDAAYAKFQLSKSNGGKPSKVGAVVREEAVATATTELLHGGEPSSCSLVARHQTAALSGEKAMTGGLWYQESCITEDESGRDSSGESSPSGNDLAYSDVAIGKMKRKRLEEEDVNREASEGSEEQPLLPLKAQKLSEEARVWQYVCKRSVFVSPPQRPKLPDEKKGASSGGCSSRMSQFGQNNVFKEKTAHVEVQVNDATVKVTLTKECSVAQEWIGRQTGQCFGLDLEWQPNRRKGHPDNKVALLQISSETECLLVQMLFLDSMPSALVQFLKDPERKIAGVGIHGDTKKLRRDFGLICGGEVELTTLAVDHFKNEELKRVGLKVLAKQVLGYDMNKNRTVTMSNWSKSHLNRRQVEYACIDAWVSHAIFLRLQEESPVVAA